MTDLIFELQEKQSESVSSSDKSLTPSRYESRFIVGGMNDGSHVSVPITVDDLEIWYGTRDYVESLCLIAPCQRNHYIIGKILHLTTCNPVLIEESELSSHMIVCSLFSFTEQTLMRLISWLLET